MSSVEETLKSVQREVRVLRMFAALLAAGLLLTVVVPRNEYRANRFVLVDDAGAQRGVLRVTDGVPALLLQDSAGSWRAVLSVDDEAASLALTRQDGKSGVALAAGNGTSSLLLYGAAGRPEMELRTSSDGPLVALPGVK